MDRRPRWLLGSIVVMLSIATTSGASAEIGSVAPAASAARDAEGPLSGLWNTTLSRGVTGTVTFRVVGAADGATALKAMGGQPCPQPTVYYHGDYTDTAPDTGTMTVCASAARFVGRYRNDNTSLAYPGGSLVVGLDSSGKRFQGSFTADDPAFSGMQFAYAGTFVKPAQDGGSTSEKGVTITSIQGNKVEVQLNESGWQPASAGLVLNPGDRIHTGWKSSVVVTVQGQSITLEPMSLILVKKDSTGSIGFLKRGLIKADIRWDPDETAYKFGYGHPLGKIIFRDGYRLGSRSLAAIGAGRQTFTVLYDDVAKALIVSVSRGSLRVDPDAPGLPTVRLNAGTEVEVTSRAVSKVAPIGRAGAPPGSVSRLRARNLVLAAAAPGSARCGAEATAVKTTRLALGWTVDLRFSGRVTGSATWTIRGTRIAPANPLASEVVAGCPGSAGNSPRAGHYSGQTSQGKSISFDVSADGRSVSNIAAAAIVTCSDSSSWTWGINSKGQRPVGSSLDFSRSYSGALTSTGSATNAKTSYSLAGHLDAAGGASGTFRLSRMSWDDSGKHYDCTGKAVSWTARRT